MSYQPEQIQEATKNCKVLRGRGGRDVYGNKIWVDVNAEAVANNPNCKKNKKTESGIGKLIVVGLGAIIVLSVFGGISLNRWY